ncbi:hypothetical protein C8R44DRAFT_96875 [Mycena epipterygia]|nr:hypothetical protein C8R44DRAFT_96875 [Mycena epipterygia]
MDDDYDMSMHTMRENLPESDRRDDECDSVHWKSSQTSNRALDTLMREAQNAMRPAQRESDWTWGSPGASTSRVRPTLFEPTASSAVVPLPVGRRRARASHPPRAQGLSIGLGFGSAPSTDPAQFLTLLKGVSKQADENAGMRASGVDSARGRRGVKQRTMATRRERERPSSVVGMGTKGKGKERELARSSSLASIASVLSSPDSNYSFASGTADTSMTSPEPDDFSRTTQDLMPPPPVPQNRLPALDTNRMSALAFPRLSHVPAALPPPSARPPELRVHPQPPPAAPRAAVPNPPRSVQQQQQQPVSSQLSSTRLPTNSRPSPAPEPRMHPLLEKTSALGSPPRAHPAPAARPNPPAPARPVPPLAQSQPQQRRGNGPPALGMRRTNTAPLAGAASALSSSQAARKFRTPFLNPTANAVAGPSRAQAPASRSQAPGGRSGPPPAVKVERGEEPVPANSSSPPGPDPDSSFEGFGGTSFDLEELEKVMQEYDD